MSSINLKKQQYCMLCRREKINVDNSEVFFLSPETWITGQSLWVSGECEPVIVKCLIKTGY